MANRNGLTEPRTPEQIALWKLAQQEVWDLNIPLDGWQARRIAAVLLRARADEHAADESWDRCAALRRRDLLAAIPPELR